MLQEYKLIVSCMNRYDIECYDIELTRGCNLIIIQLFKRRGGLPGARSVARRAARTRVVRSFGARGGGNRLVARARCVLVMHHFRGAPRGRSRRLTRKASVLSRAA